MPRKKTTPPTPAAELSAAIQAVAATPKRRMVGPRKNTKHLIDTCRNAIQRMDEGMWDILDAGETPSGPLVSVLKQTRSLLKEGLDQVSAPPLQPTLPISAQGAPAATPPPAILLSKSNLQVADDDEAEDEEEEEEQDDQDEEEDEEDEDEDEDDD